MHFLAKRVSCISMMHSLAKGGFMYLYDTFSGKRGFMYLYGAFSGKRAFMYLYDTFYGKRGFIYLYDALSGKRGFMYLYDTFSGRGGFMYLYDTFSGKRAFMYLYDAFSGKRASMYPGFSPEIFEGMVAFSGIVKLVVLQMLLKVLTSNSLSLTSTFIYLINFVVIKKILFNLLLKEISVTSFPISVSKQISIKMKNSEASTFNTQFIP